MPFWQNLELLPSSTREKAQEKPKRSAEEYAESRDKVKEDVRDAKERRIWNAQTAEVMLYIETNEEALKEKMSKEKPEDVLKGFMSYDARQWSQLKTAFSERHFDLKAEETKEGPPIITASITLPEGNITETMELSQSLQDALISRATKSE